MTAEFSFGVDFQTSLIAVLLRDSVFADAVSPHVDTSHFENESLAWLYAEMTRYRTVYGYFPSQLVLREKLRGVEASIREPYEVALYQVESAVVRDERWIKDQVLEWVKRNIFVSAYAESRELYNVGKTEEAYEHLQGEMDRLARTRWEEDDDGWFFEELPQRQAERTALDASNAKIGTGIQNLDIILEGGLGKGEMGVWIAYPKVGKTTMLINHGVLATRGQFRNTAHVVLEGSRQMVEARYDSCFMDEFYSAVKVGDVDAQRYSKAHGEYQVLKRKLVVMGMTDKWSYTVPDIWARFQTLKTSMGWEPDMIIVDYADLLHGCKSHYSNEHMSGSDAYRDLKSLANRGYAVWTAAQAQRPAKADFETCPHLITSRSIAGMFEKVRVADFIGSINQTVQERGADGQGSFRAYLELYRDNAAHKVVSVPSHFGKMCFGGAGEYVITNQAAAAQVTAAAPPTLGYVQQKAGG